VDRTNAERQRRYIARLKARRGVWNGAICIDPANPPTSWQIVVITKDGQRWGNDARIATEAEADAYRMTHAIKAFWDAYKLEKPSLKEPPAHRAVVATEAIPTNDAPNVSMIRRRGKITGELGHGHGGCGLLVWHALQASP
jgi:hypothetical protein